VGLYFKASTTPEFLNTRWSGEGSLLLESGAASGYDWCPTFPDNVVVSKPRVSIAQWCGVKPPPPKKKPRPQLKK